MYRGFQEEQVLLSQSVLRDFAICFPAQINPQHKRIRDISYLKHQRRLFELVPVLGTGERSDG